MSVLCFKWLCTSPVLHVVWDPVIIGTLLFMPRWSDHTLSMSHWMFSQWPMPDWSLWSQWTHQKNGAQVPKVKDLLTILLWFIFKEKNSHAILSLVTSFMYVCVREDDFFLEGERVVRVLFRQNCAVLSLQNSTVYEKQYIECWIFLKVGGGELLRSKIFHCLVQMDIRLMSF